jgi:hypothetical protein
MHQISACVVRPQPCCSGCIGRLPILGASERASHIEALFGAAARIGPCRPGSAQVAVRGCSRFAAKMPD